MGRTTGGGFRRALLWTVVGLMALVVAVPVLVVWWLSSPEPAPSPGDGTMDALRDVAYTLRNERVREADDRGAGLEAVATTLGTPTLSAAQIRAAADPGEGRLVLIGLHRVGGSGLGVDLIESAVPVQQPSGLFAREVRPWVGCYRVVLPVLAIDATAWTAEDIACPTFSDALQRADRVHVSGATARPLLRPPCFGTTGFCPGG